jgi:hypothetical protein
MRRSTALDPVVARELEAVDAVLAGERRDPELSLIADEVRAGAPPMPPGLALRLDAAAVQGFPRPKGKGRAGWLPRLPLIPALGTLASVALVIVIATSVNSGSGDHTAQLERVTQVPEAPSDSAGAGSEATGSSGRDTASSPAAPSAAAAPTAARDSEALQKVITERRVKRAADLTIATPIAKLQETSDAVTHTVDRLGGFVAQSEVSSAGQRGQATFALRIPTARLDDALATLSRLGHVRSRSQESDDITARFVSARSRLHDARAERQALLRALAEAATSQEIDSINARLEIARSRIAAAKGDLFGARRTAAFARVGVTVIGVAGEDEGAAAGGHDGWTPGKALEDAVDLLSVASGVAIVAIAGAIPAALLALLALLAWRVYRRRSRELALERQAPAV